MGLPVFIAAPIARLARLASRLSGREGGALPGKVLLALSPRALRRMRRRLGDRPVVLVSATNGKTTLAAMLVAVLEQAGLRVTTNLTGANLRSGLATTLLQAGRRAGDAVVLEVDEATMPRVCGDLDPDVVVLGNLFRDQLDRYGELEVLGNRWLEALEQADGERCIVCYDADDPLVARVAELHGERVQAAGGEPRLLAWGMDAPEAAAPSLPHAADSTTCRHCGARLHYERSWVGHLGEWRCASCGAERPRLDVAAVRADADGLASTQLVVRRDVPIAATGLLGVDDELALKLRVPGIYNAYNAVGAVAAASALDLSGRLAAAADVIAAGLEEASPAFGRFERIPVPGGGTLTFLLVKNPTGLNEVVRTLVAGEVDLTATLFALNDGIADGRDTSWVWDADLEPLFERVPALVVTGTRGAELALRAAYGGVDAGSLLVEDDLEQALYRLLERAREFSDHGHAYALVTYTAMLRMRGIVAERGWTTAYWANDPERARRSRRRFSRRRRGRGDTEVIGR